MSSIASETKSVQTAPTQITNGKQEPNVNQKTTQSQTKALHIAEGTTNGEQSESRQSGAEHPNQEMTGAEQGFCKTSQGERFNKYNHAIFAGYRGEEYLHWILKLILPYALYRTWARAVSFQAPGKTCYVGATRIAQQEKAGVRKIEIDLQELEARGLMRRTSQQQAFQQEDGTVTYGMVKTKDFSRLYDLASEYHLWITRPDCIPAEWDNAEQIRKDARLYLKLMRFDNYRHILTCQKPGPKGKRTPLQEIYHCQQPEEEVMPGPPPAGTGDPKANLYLNVCENLSSPYRESKNQESLLPKENSISSVNSEGGVFASVEPTTIRKTQQRDQIEQGVEVQRTDKIEEKTNESKEERKASNDREETQHIEPPRKKEIGAETAKSEEVYTIEDLTQNPLAMIAFLLQLNEQEHLKQEQDQAKKKSRHHKGQPKRKRLATPEQLARIFTQMVQDLGGNPKYLQSDLTRVTKIYWACTQIFSPFTNVWFLERLSAAFVKTCKARKVKNRVAYFFSTLETDLGLHADERAYIRSQEALYHDGDLKTFVLGLEHSHHKSGSQLDYQEWVKQTYL